MWRSAHWTSIQADQSNIILLLATLLLAAQRRWVALGVVLVVIPVVLGCHVFLFRRALARGVVTEPDASIAPRSMFDGWGPLRTASAIVVMVALAALVLYLRIIWSSHDIE